MIYNPFKNPVTTLLKFFFTGCCFIFCCLPVSCAQTGKPDLKVIIIRHGEKPASGDNLNCQGLNRARLLPPVVVAKFGIPGYTYVPSLSADFSTKHARMFQTITPLAVKYNLSINSSFDVKNTAGLAADIVQKRGTVLVVWEHNNMADILHALGIKDTRINWDVTDFDSIWIVNFTKGVATFVKDKEGLQPAAACN